MVYFVKFMWLQIFCDIYVLSCNICNPRFQLATVKYTCYPNVGTYIILDTLRSYCQYSQWTIIFIKNSLEMILDIMEGFILLKLKSMSKIK